MHLVFMMQCLNINHMNKLGKFIRNTRNIRKISQASLARAIGHSPAYVCDLEKGRRGTKISPLTAIKIANYLNVTIELMFENAGIGGDESAYEYADIVLRNIDAERGERIGRSLSTLREVAGQLTLLATTEYPQLRQMAITIQESAKELDNYLRIGSGEELANEKEC